MLIELSELNFKLLLPLIFPLFNQIEQYSKKAYIVKDNQLFKTFRYFVSYIFSGLVYLIFKIRNRKKSSIEIEKDNNNNYNYINELIKKNERKKNIAKFIFLMVLCATGMFCYFFRKLFEAPEYQYAKQSIGIFFEIISLTLFSFVILNQKLYKHHYISLGIISALLLALFILSISFMENILSSFFYYLCYAILFCLYDVLKKKYMNLFYNTPYFMMLIIGSINTTLLIIYDVIAYYANPDFSGVIIGFQKNINSEGDVFLLILDLFLEYIWNLGFWLTIYYFSPCYNFISEYIAEYIFYILSAIKENDEYYSTLNIIIFSICYFINLFCIIIFNEVLILNFCGMDYNTKKRIQQRERNDSEVINTESWKCLNNESEISED